jgi:predicted regulator of amino acid metabolism with ACT domain
MIRTARVLLAGLLHILAARVDVHDTYIVDVEQHDDSIVTLVIEDRIPSGLLNTDAIIQAIDRQARLN